MVIGGRWLVLVVILLAAWLILLCRTWWKLLRTPPLEGKPVSARNYLTITGLGSSAVAVGALLALHLSWISAGVSQHLGVPSDQNSSPAPVLADARRSGSLRGGGGKNTMARVWHLSRNWVVVA